MTIVAAIFAIAFVALLLSRVHFHFHFGLQVTRDEKRPRSPKMAVRDRARRSAPGTGLAESSEAGQNRIDPALADQKDIVAALCQLGAKKQQANELAVKSLPHGGDFDSRLKWALQNVGGAK